MTSKAQKRRQRQARNQTKMQMYEQFREDAGSVEIERAAKPEPDPRATVCAARVRRMTDWPEAKTKIEERIKAQQAVPIGKLMGPVHDADAVDREFIRRAIAVTDRPIFGEPAGQALALTCKAEEADRLWGTFKLVDAADDTYARRFTGIRRFPNVSKLELMPERLETRPNERVDVRTQDEKDRDAVNEWMRWQGLLGRLDRDQHTAIVDAMRHRARLVHAGRTTRSGKSFVAAMRALDDQYQRR